MRIRKLERAEHGLTRALYEEVFSEDDGKFVDYYYKWKTRDNEIYVAEDEDGIHAMVHLNPFSVVYHGSVQQMHYIVAVATQKKYRHQGLMRRLLAMAEQDMEAAGENFTFLMPASEKIYLPFGYRFFAWQRQGILRAEKNIAEQNERAHSSLEERVCTEKRGASVICRPVHPQDYEALAQFANEILDRQYKLYVKRDASYYERLCAEQQCQGGDVMVITLCSRIPGQRTAGNGGLERSGKEPISEKMIGVFCTAPDETEEEESCAETGEKTAAAANRPVPQTIPRPVLREVLLDQSCFQSAQNALLDYIHPYGFCKVEGCQSELVLTQESSVPLMMGKVPGGGVLAEPPERDSVFLNEVV